MAKGLEVQLEGLPVGAVGETFAAFFVIERGRECGKCLGERVMEQGAFGCCVGGERGVGLGFNL